MSSDQECARADGVACVRCHASATHLVAHCVRDGVVCDQWPLGVCMACAKAALRGHAGDGSAACGIGHTIELVAPLRCTGCARLVTDARHLRSYVASEQHAALCAHAVKTLERYHRRVSAQHAAGASSSIPRVPCRLCERRVVATVRHCAPSQRSARTCTDRLTDVCYTCVRKRAARCNVCADTLTAHVVHVVSARGRSTLPVRHASTAADEARVASAPALRSDPAPGMAAPRSPGAFENAALVDGVSLDSDRQEKRLRVRARESPDTTDHVTEADARHAEELARVTCAYELHLQRVRASEARIAARARAALKQARALAAENAQLRAQLDQTRAAPSAKYLIHRT